MSFIASVTRQKFLASEDAAWAKEQLEEMTHDDAYNTPTRPFYIHGQVTSPSFTDQHLLYLSEHPNLKVVEYISNLRLKTRKWNAK